MARIDLLDAQSAEGGAQRALASSIGHMGVFRALANAPANLVPLMKLGRSILAEQALDARRRELLILLAMQIEGGEYEYVQHVEIALCVGATNAEIDAISKFQLDADCFDESDRALLTFGATVVRDVRVPDAIYAEAARHFPARLLVEGVIAMGYYMLLARVTEAFEVPADVVQGMDVLQSANDEAARRRQ